MHYYICIFFYCVITLVFMITSFLKEMNHSLFFQLSVLTTAKLVNELGFYKLRFSFFNNGGGGGGRESKTANQLKE